MAHSIGRSGINWRLAAWSAAAGLIALPLVAMQFTTEVRWTPSDFVFAGILIGGTGLMFELAVRLSSSVAYRAGIALALLATVLLVWINAAVGIIGAEDNPANLMFAVVPAVAIVGAGLARFRARGMARAMIAAVVAQCGVAIAAMVLADAFILPITVLFCALWLAAAWLFGRAE
ncbi:MAG: hypothetical protein V4537_02680 [Pseudomonadota bacterium]